MDRPLESLKFIQSDQKPTIGRIRPYLDSRLQITQEIGLTPSNDFLGNTVITSSEHEERTFAGNGPSTLIASPEGIHIIANNPRILSRIYNGTVQHNNHAWKGSESRVYQIALQTDAGQKKFALKYTFPITLGGDFRFFTSGIVAMRMMQLADKERPIPYVHYTVPIFATHDFTVAPFVFDGINTCDFMLCLDYPDREKYFSDLLNANNLTSNQKYIIQEMRQQEYEAKQHYRSTFIKNVETALESKKGTLVDWVYKQRCQYPEFTQHLYRTDDTSFNQSVINLDEIYRLSHVFYENPTFNSDNPTFVSTLLNTLSMVELGVGRIYDL